MIELYDKFKQIIKEEKAKIPDEYGFVWRLMNAVEAYFKQTGKQGGDTTKKQNPDYSAIGKKGAAKRWEKK
ncbi:MAG TPA: hypothetical protein VEP90_21480 [Methylomirabilota bacterium]|nr:hypothetical protein [Methylomirabilota bacterium]